MMRKKVNMDKNVEMRDGKTGGKNFGRAFTIAMALSLCMMTGLTLTACGNDDQRPQGPPPGVASGGAAGFDGKNGPPEGWAPGEKPEGMPEDWEPGDKPEGLPDNFQPPEGWEPGERPEGAPEDFQPPEGWEPGERPEGAPDSGSQE